MKSHLPSSLPAGWTMPPVYARYSVQLGKMLDEKQITGTYLAPYLRNADVQWNGINTTDLPEMDFTAEDRERFLLHKGDLLVCEGGEVGRTAIWDGSLSECYFQKAIHRLRPLTQHDEPRYFRYFMWMSADSGQFTQSTASTIQHLTAEKLRNVRYPSPPYSQQRIIADFLDRKTAGLDALIAAKERLLALLAEKRRALITRAVTRGLDARVSLKDSGIPWLGAIPAHWETRRAAWLFRERDKRGKPDLPLLEVSIDAGVVLREFSQERIEATAADFNTYKVARHDDVVFNKMRMWQGAVGVAPVDGLVSPDYVVAAPTGLLLPAYAGLLFRTEIFSAECARHSHGIVWDRLRLYWDGFRDIELPLPPTGEQTEIVNHVGVETAILDALRSSTERTSGLLKERRAALIAAAVTGQIDTGGWHEGHEA